MPQHVVNVYIIGNRESHINLTNIMKRKMYSTHMIVTVTHGLVTQSHSHCLAKPTQSQFANIVSCGSISIQVFTNYLC